MNRAEKRRQRKLAKKTAKPADDASARAPSAEKQSTDFQQELDLAVQHHSAGRLPEAQKIYQQILGADPNHPKALHLFGLLAHQTGHNDIAQELMTKCLSIEPDFAEAHCNLGIVLKEIGEPEKAVASYRKALALNPNFAMAYSNLGIVLFDLGELNEAVENYQKAIALNPNFDMAHNNLGNAFIKLGKLDEAVTSFERALAINPELAMTQNNLGNALKDLGRLDEAIDCYHKALAINPQFEEVWNNLKFAAKALQFSESGAEPTSDASAHGLNKAAKATPSYAIHQFYLAGFRPHEADEAYEKMTAALPPVKEQTTPVDRKRKSPPLPDNVVALLSFGRSGTGLLHSLIDGHPEISTLPSIFLNGYFNEGVWEKLILQGWRRLPERFADEFAVLFDARISKPVPSRLGEQSFSLGKKEGMTVLGENRDEFLSLDRKTFCDVALKLMEGMDSINPYAFLMVVHAAYEAVSGKKDEAGLGKPLCFYHLHNPDHYAKANFLRYAPNARLLMTVREPVRNCESSLRVSLHENNYDMAIHRILGMLYAIDQTPFRRQEAVGIRLEDLKDRPDTTLQALSTWLGVGFSPTLKEMTAQGKKWWGDPSSPDYGKENAMSPFDDTITRRPIGSILGEKDQFVLATLFHPFSVRFGYREPSPEQFRKDLTEIRPLIDEMFDFEKEMAKRSNVDHQQFRKTGSYRLFRAGLVERWRVLDECGEYPSMLVPLPIP